MQHVQLHKISCKRQFFISVVLLISKCLYGVEVEDIKKIIEVLSLKRELLIICKSLKVDENVTSTKLLGIKYNMDDNKKVVEEAQTIIAIVKDALSKV